MEAMMPLWNLSQAGADVRLIAELCARTAVCGTWRYAPALDGGLPLGRAGADDKP